MAKSGERAEILQILEASKTMISKDNNEEAYTNILKGVSKILKSNFLPLLDSFLDEHISVCTKLGKNYDIVTDYFIRLAPQVRTSNPGQIVNSMLDFLGAADQMQFTLPKHFRPLFPIRFSIKFDKERIISGSKVNILTTIVSNIAVSLPVESLSFALLHDSDKEKEEIISVADSFELEPKKPFRITTERNLPPAISTELIRGLILRVKSAAIRIPLSIPKLSISPDISACSIGMKMPDRCIIGARLPVVITLTAGEQKIERISVHFTPVNQAADPIEIKGTFNDIQITDQPAELPDIEPLQSATLNMTVFSLVPSYNPVMFTVNFGTALSGSGEFTRVLPFQFLSPFSSDIKIFDDNFIEIPSNATPMIEHGVQLTAEVTLTNLIDCSIKILAIEANGPEVDTIELPMAMNPYETFSFLVNIKNPGEFEVKLSYEIEGFESNVFIIKLPEIQKVVRHATFTLESPSSAVLYKEFTAKILIERVEEVGGPEVVPVKFEIGSSPGFFINGPTKKHIVHLFRGQKKEIPIKFLPLEAGSTTLPQILLTDATTQSKKPKSFLIPIVVTYQ